MHILLTGASRGIGRGFAETVLEQGASLSVCARTPHSLDTLAAKGAHAHVLDVTDATAVQRWVTAAVAQHGPIDAVVNNAALLGPKATVADYSIDAWRQVMDVNVDGPFL
ncbi:MAG: SDR family oxidoreductase, partial [Myxococcota bacterium]|nr:SDR family oxidoreductase [Myxococcota bacterium]